LVLSGPAGSGKTACLTQLAKEHQVEVLEWKEESNVSNANDDRRIPLPSAFKVIDQLTQVIDADRESMVHRFTSFLARAGMAPSLEFTDAPTDTSSNPVASTSGPSPSNPNARRLILLEDLPNISHFPTKLALRSALQQFLTSPRVTCPLVLIVSEALARPGADSLENGGGWVRNEDSLDSRSVCGLQVLQHPACREIR
jgi:cell cycle checkpoint protein